MSYGYTLFMEHISFVEERCEVPLHPDPEGSDQMRSGLAESIGDSERL